MGASGWPLETKFCGSPEHSVGRRRFLGTMAAGAAAFAADMGGLERPQVGRRWPAS